AIDHTGAVTTGIWNGTDIAGGYVANLAIILAHMGDSDHGDVEWSGGDAFVQAATYVDSTSAGNWVALTDAAAGTHQDLLTDQALLYDATDGTLSATQFVGGGVGLTALAGDNITDDSIDNTELEDALSVETSLSIGIVDPADAGSLRMQDDENITWEGTAEVSITGNLGDTLEIINTQEGILLSGTTATECVMLDASGINCDTTAGCTPETIAGNVFDYKTANFANTEDNYGAWSFQIPDNIVGNTFVATVTWT
ncbi:unnamed protein product, partial [marine sediment metagenome]